MSMERVKKVSNAARKWMPSRIWKVSVLLFVSGVVAAHAQVVPLPFASDVAGLAPGTSAAVCSTALNSIGDGCPAAQASIPLNKLSASWTDRYGNIYFVDYDGSYEVRVIYEGGQPLATLIKANNPTVTQPQVGSVYAIAGSTSRTAAFASGAYCNGSTGTVMLDTAGDGCPGYQAFTKVSGGDTDSDGDVYLTDNPGFQAIRVIYAGGAAAANLIRLEGGTSSPVVGNIYLLGGWPGYGTGYKDGALAYSKNTLLSNPHSLQVDSSGNLYIADSGNNAVRLISATTGIISTIAGTGCVSGNVPGCVAGYTGDTGAATSAELKNPYEITLDASGNIYISDYGNARIRVIYKGGTLLGISSPTTNNIYTVIGGGSSTTPGITAQNLQLVAPIAASFDAAGNIYVPDPNSSSNTVAIYRVDGKTGVVSIITSLKRNYTVGAYCTGSSGPTATDTVGDGCPSTQAVVLKPHSRLAFAPNGVGYIADAYPYNSTTSGLIRAFTINQQFPTMAVGSSSTMWAAVTSMASFAAPAISATVEGTSTDEFTASATTCTVGSNYAASAACSYKLQFTPTLPGARAGEYVFSQSGTTILTQGLAGNGQAALLAVAPNSAAITLGSSIASVSNITTDMLGNLYLSDTSTGTLWKIVSGSSTATALLTGLSSPAQSAVDGVGNVYVADTGNNRIIEYTASGSTVSLLTGLSAPKGVAVTGNGTLYVTDTGNNRILLYLQGATSTSVLPITGLNAPTALALDASGDLFIADTSNQRVVEYANGIQTALSFGSVTVKPLGLAVDAAGDIYVSDGLTNSVLRLITGASSSVSLASGLGSASGISLDAQGDLFYADSTVAGFKEVVQQQGSFAFATAIQNTSSAPETVGLANIGNATLNFTSSPGYAATDTTDFSVAVAGTNGCTTSAPINPGGQCALTATFQPQTAGVFTDTVSFASNAVNGAASLTLSGTGVQGNTTSTTTLSIPTTTVVAGQSVSMTGSVTLSTGSATGSVSIYDGSSLLGTTTLGSGGSYAYSTSSLSIGTHSISATYGGQTGIISASSSAAIVVNITAAGNIWVANSNGTLSEFSNAGMAISTTSGYSGGGSGIAIGSSANIWSGTTSGTTLTRFSSDGTLAGSYTGVGGVTSPVSVAIDGLGNVWVANANSTVSELTSTGYALSPSTGFTGGSLNTPTAVAIDGSGNVWITNSGDSSLTEFFGAGSPAVTPLATAAANGAQGTTP